MFLKHIHIHTHTQTHAFKKHIKLHIYFFKLTILHRAGFNYYIILSHMIIF